MFFGESTQLAGDAIESTSSVALAYLVTTGIVTIDDSDSADWSSYDCAESFQNQLASLTATKKGLIQRAAMVAVQHLNVSTN